MWEWKVICESGYLMPCQFHHAIDKTFDVEQRRFRFGDTGETAVIFYKREKSFARGADGVQAIADLVSSFFVGRDGFTFSLLISSLPCISVSNVSLSEVIGVTEFIISCVSTRVRRIQESISFSSSSLLISFRARIRKCS